MNNSILFKPLKIGSAEIRKSRFVVPAMNGHSVDGNMFQERAAAYFLERARGGFGMIISEWLAVDPNGLGSLKQAGAWDDKFIPSLTKFAEIIHTEDVILIGQIHHAGFKSKSHDPDFIPKAVSEISDNGRIYEALTLDEMIQIRDEFISAAKRVKQAGFDGVEVHGAHGYFLEQVMSRRYNRRIDKYGGTYENRFRLIAEIISTIRNECGSDFVIGFRINSREGYEPDCFGVEETAIYARMAEQAGADYISVSHKDILSSYYKTPGFNQNDTAEIKKHVSIPVICVGRINDEHVAEEILASGKADLIALGRQSICDPYFPRKIYEGKKNLLFHCMGCRQRCSPDIGCEADDIGSSCMINPFTNKETRWKILRTDQPKKVVVIGAGCAGLQCSWILAARGHDVTIYEKNDHIGGNLIAASAPPMKYGFLQALQTEMEHCREYGVKIILNTEITQNDLLDLKADCVINAIGSEPFKPDIKGIEHCTAAEDILLNRTPVEQGRIAVLGGGMVGMETAEYLMQYGNQVDVIEMKSDVAEDMVPAVRTELLQELDGKVTIYTDTKIQAIEESNILTAKKNESPITLQGYDRVITAMGYKSRTGISNPEKQGAEYYVIGDAKQARNAKMAIYEATKLALKI